SGLAEAGYGKPTAAAGGVRPAAAPILGGRVGPPRVGIRPRAGSGRGDPVMSWTEVTELVGLAQAGDRVAFGELVSRFQGAVFAMALTRVHDPVEAQELAQEVFVHAMRKLPQLRDPRCFAGWLRKITAR